MGAEAEEREERREELAKERERGCVDRPCGGSEGNCGESEGNCGGSEGNGKALKREVGEAGRSVEEWCANTSRSTRLRNLEEE